MLRSAAIESAALRPRWCAACGQATGGGPCGNRWCGRPDRRWSVVHAVDVYHGSLRGAIVGYKYHGRLDRAPLLAGMLARFLQDHHSWFEEYDLVTDMPAYEGVGARRSWSPVGRLVKDLAQLVGPGWEVRPDLVVKTQETEPMSGRGRWERTRIAEGPLRQALRPGGIDVTGARILVVDDVFTEGSTLREVARVLRASGAEEVAGLVLARAPFGRSGAA